MSRTLRVGVVQVRSSSSKAENLDRTEQLVALAASRGAEVVVLPELWNVVGPPDVLRESAESLSDGESVDAMARWARTQGIRLVGGSIIERHPDDRCTNTCVVFEQDGNQVAIYRKIHLFDVDVGGRSYRESQTTEGGTSVVACELGGWRFGLTVCYDLRFPELYRILALRGCELVTVPAKFTEFTGKDHWDLLLRARAVENQYFVVAAAQWGRHDDGTAAFGRSMIIDPWGIVLAQAPDEDCVVTADLDIATLTRVRDSLPSLRNRVPEAYAWPDVDSPERICDGQSDVG